MFIMCVDICVGDGNILAMYVWVDGHSRPK